MKSSKIGRFFAVALAAFAGATHSFAGRSLPVFENAGFEEVSKFHAEKDGVEVADGLGYSTSGGMRIFPAWVFRVSTTS